MHSTPHYSQLKRSYDVFPLRQISRDTSTGKMIYCIKLYKLWVFVKLCVLKVLLKNKINTPIN